MVLGVVSALPPLDLGITRSDDTIPTRAALLDTHAGVPGQPWRIRNPEAVDSEGRE